MRELTRHHDGYGLNEAISVRTTDSQGPGGAHHRYEMWIDSDYVGFLQFQQGPRNEPESIPGVVEAAVLAVLIDRLEAFQTGPYACPENQVALDAMFEAMEAIKQRAANRASRGVLGTYNK